MYFECCEIYDPCVRCHKERETCKNTKYSINKILKISRFNLISKNWKEIVLALGGINKKNLNNLGMLKYRGFAFYTFLQTIKNP